MVLFEPYAVDTKVASMKMMLAVINEKERNSCLIHHLRQNTSYVVLGVEDSLQAQEVTTEVIPDFLLIDYRLSGIDGLTLYVHMQMTPALRGIPTLIINTPLVLEHAWRTKRDVICLNESFRWDELVCAIDQLEASSPSGLTPAFDVTIRDTPRSLKRIRDVRE